MSGRTLTSKFGGKCNVCGKAYAAGDSIHWDKALQRGRRGRHLACLAPGANEENGPQAAPQGPQARPAGAAVPSVSTPLTGGAKPWPKNLHRQVFGSVAECVDFSNQTSEYNEARRQQHDSGAGNSLGNSLSWYGVAGGPSVVKAILAAGEWPEGVARMQEALGNIGADLPKPRSVKRARVRREFGSEVDVTEYWRGRGDQAWQHCERANRSGPQVVTVAFNMSIMAAKNASSLFWRGAAALCLADKLTEAGYNVEIIGMECGTKVSQDGRKDAMAEILVKPATAPLDLNALAVTACFAGFFRMTMFKVIDNFPFPVESGLGREVTYRDLVGDADTRTMFIADGGKVENAAGARQWVTDCIASLEQGARAAA